MFGKTVFRTDLMTSQQGKITVSSKLIYCFDTYRNVLDQKKKHKKQHFQKSDKKSVFTLLRDVLSQFLVNSENLEQLLRY